MKAIGIILIALGILGIVYGGISWTRHKTIIDAGPVELKTEKRESVPIPPVVGLVSLVAGIAMVASKRS
jgi:uncharacterized membrane protein YidH (DUF202 family)